MGIRFDPVTQMYSYDGEEPGFQCVSSLDMAKRLVRVEKVSLQDAAIAVLDAKSEGTGEPPLYRTEP